MNTDDFFVGFIRSVLFVTDVRVKLKWVYLASIAIVNFRSADRSSTRMKPSNLGKLSLSIC